MEQSKVRLLDPLPCLGFRASDCKSFAFDMRGGRRVVQLHAWAPFSFLRGGGARSPRQAHNLETAGSNPAPATMAFTRSCSAQLVRAAPRRGAQVVGSSPINSARSALRGQQVPWPRKAARPRPARGLGRGAGSCGSRATGRRRPDNARASGAESSRIQDAGEGQAIGDGGGPNNRKCPGCPGARILCLHGASVVRPDLPGDSLVRL